MEPFPHFAAPFCLEERVADALLIWFRTAAPWAPQGIAGFYQLQKVDLLQNSPPGDASLIVAPVTIAGVQAAVEQIFTVSIKDPPKIDAHWLQAGERIAIHTDHGPAAQTHRVVVQVNDGWTPANGGLLLLTPSRTPENLTGVVAYQPAHRSAVGFEISARSFHAVTPVESGLRFTVAFSFQAKGI